jgi:hypothetical protein
MKNYTLHTNLTFPKQKYEWFTEPHFDIVDEPLWDRTLEEITKWIQAGEPYNLNLAMDVQVDDDMGGGIYLRGNYDKFVHKHKMKTKGMEVFLNGFLSPDQMKSLYTSKEDFKHAVDYSFLNREFNKFFEIIVYRSKPYFRPVLDIPVDLFDEIHFESDSAKDFVKEYFSNKSGQPFEKIDAVSMLLNVNIQEYGRKILARHIYPTIVNELFYLNRYCFSEENPDFEYFERCRNDNETLWEFLSPSQWKAGLR